MSSPASPDADDAPHNDDAGLGEGLSEADIDVIWRRYERFATDEDMPNREWEALQIEVLKDNYRLLLEVRRLRRALEDRG